MVEHENPGTNFKVIDRRSPETQARKAEMPEHIGDADEMALKNCPFCGGEGQISKFGNPFCRDCGALIRGEDPSAWNRRAPEPDDSQTLTAAYMLGFEKGKEAAREPGTSVAMIWTSIEKELPKHTSPVLVAYRWASPYSGKSGMAVWIGVYFGRGEKDPELWFNDDCADDWIDGECEEIDGGVYVKPGWWLLEDDADGANQYYRDKGKITHWMELPEPPEGFE